MKRTPEYEALVKDIIALYRKGKSAGEIANLLGGTRNRVIGVLHRNKNDIDRKLHFGNRGTTPPKPVQKERRLRAVKAVIVRAPVVVEALSPPYKPIEGRMQYLDALLDKQKRCMMFATAPTAPIRVYHDMVCGVPIKPGESFCADCHKIVYTPVSRDVRLTRRTSSANSLRMLDID